MRFEYEIYANKINKIKPKIARTINTSILKIINFKFSINSENSKRELISTLSEIYFPFTLSEETFKGSYSFALSGENLIDAL